MFKAQSLRISAPRMVGKIFSSLPSMPTLASLPRIPPWASWRGRNATPTADAGAESAAPESRRMTSLVAVAALATMAGAFGGVLATSLLPQFSAAATTTSDGSTLEASVARIDSDVQALKAGTDQAAQPGQGLALDNQTSDRLDRLERAEAESSAKIVRLNEATERLRVAMLSTPGMAPTAPAASRDTTRSVQASAAASAFGAVRPATPKPDAGRLPIVQGWTLRDVNHGLARIEGRNGFYEVHAGDPIAGLGRVDAIRRQDGRWVVVTSKGLVVTR
jgi:hypothetical protein